MTERRRRKHPAGASRILVAGLSAAGLFGTVGAMTLAGRSSEEPTQLIAVTAGTATPATPPTPAPVVIIVRRHHPAPVDAAAAPTGRAPRSSGNLTNASSGVTTTSAATASGTAPAATPAPATASPAPTTRSAPS